MHAAPAAAGDIPCLQKAVTRARALQPTRSFLRRNTRQRVRARRRRAYIACNVTEGSEEGC